ncbi:Heat-labile enterotoxin, A chain [Metarhizium brunneum]
MGEAFNSEFVKRFPELVKRSPSQENREPYSPNRRALETMPYHKQPARIRPSNVEKYLRSVPVSMPPLLDTAFVVGQSKGLEHIDKMLLSGRDYIKMEVKDASGMDLPATVIDTLTLRHTIDAVKVLQRRLTEEELTDDVPGGKEVRQRVQILTAMKCGRLYEDAKLEALERQRQHYPDNLGTKALFVY